MLRLQVVVLSVVSSVAFAMPAGAMSLAVEPSIPGPVLLGTPVVIQARVSDINAPVLYRFRVRSPGSLRFRTVRDYSPADSFAWAPIEGEGTYDWQVSAQVRSSGETVDTTTSYRVDSRAQGDVPVITPTSNALVFLYSAPPCLSGSIMRVEFAPSGTAGRQLTPPLRCTGTVSMNVYLAGLRPVTEYKVHHIITARDGSVLTGPELVLSTSAVDLGLPAIRSVQQNSGRSREGFLLQSNVFSMNVATDLDGNLVWYNPDRSIRYLTQAEPVGLFVAEIDDWGADDSGQLLRVLDLAGNIVAETNAGRINEMLAARGMQPMTSFHHDARVLENGKILVLAGNERIIEDMQGEGEVAVIGDVILVLDRDLQVEWAWDAFEHMDVRRTAILGETCAFGTGGCPVFRAAPVGNDWLHGNSVQLTPDGHILYSARHQDWLIKIDYANGAGSGNVIWRLGKGGDFAVISDDPDPWFSHQHDGNFELDTPNRLIVFDNGNTRYASNTSIHSRGQVWELDETNRTAKLVVNLDLGDYSRALGSAEKLANGNYHFGLGWDSRNFGQSLEYDSTGKLVTQIEAETQMYRAYRLNSIYVP